MARNAVAMMVMLIAVTMTTVKASSIEKRRSTSSVMNMSKDERSLQMRKQFLEEQNQARSKVGVPPLQWDEGLRRYAAWYANRRRADCELKHSDGAYGENIFWGSGSHWTPAQAVAAWVAEGKYYNHDNNSCSGPDCSHYTQIVWRNSIHVGCALIRCNSGDTFATCNYSPPGNYIGARPY